MRRAVLASVAAFALVAAACTGGGGEATPTGGKTPGAVRLVMWMGYTPPAAGELAYEYTSLKSIVDAFAEEHPNIQVSLQYVNSDFALQKVTVALQGNKQPDISYQYGTNMPQLAQAPKLVDLTDRVQEPGFNWEDFFPGERAVTTVNGRVLGIPALVDNLAVVYNKDLFEANGVPEPSPDWTWDDLRSAAKAISDPAKKIFGLAFPADASETMVWQYIALLWEAGGDILTPDNSKAAFNSPAGVRALTMLQQIHQDGSMYVDFHPDSGKSEQLLNSGKIGMIITGPWDLPSFPDVNYGVQIMPSFDPGGSHETIAGPDNWVIFDNGPDRVNAAWELLKWITSPENVLKNSLATGQLPLRASVEEMPEFSQFDERYPGAGTFAENLKNVLKARPQIPQYPQVSGFLGQGLVKALLGQATPQEALDEAAKQADGVLAVPA